MHERGVVEAGVDDDVGDVELLVVQRLRRRRHVVLAQPDLQDVADARGEREAGKERRERREVGQETGFQKNKIEKSRVTNKT